jgi:hypothetical protein
MADGVVEKQRDWMKATRAALLALAENFPADGWSGQSSGEERGVLTPAQFPCQKSDVKQSCGGWSFLDAHRPAAPSRAIRCACMRGRDLNFAPILEASWEIKKAGASFRSSQIHRLNVFHKVESQDEFVDVLMTWMWKAAAGGSRPRQQADWVSELRECRLEPEQLQTLRWWARVIELSALTDNERFTVIMRSAAEGSYKAGHISALRNMLAKTDSESFPEMALLVLNGPELSPAGFHSERNAWFEAFLSVIDELGLGLCLIAKQPLLPVERERQTAPAGEYRWRSGVSRKNINFGVQDVLRRGAWDRLCEALARGEALLQNEKRSGGVVS